MLIRWQPFGRQLHKRRGRAVFLGQDEGTYRPLYTDRRIAPGHAGVGLRVVPRRALVSEERHLAGDQETVGEAFSDAILALVLRGEGHSGSLPEGQ